MAPGAEAAGLDESMGLVRNSSQPASRQRDAVARHGVAVSAMMGIVQPRLRRVLVAE